MSQTDRTDTKSRIADALGSFLQRYRRVFVIGLIIIAAALIAFFVYTEVTNARLESSTRLVETLQEDYDQWLNAEEGEQRQELEEALLEDAESIISTYPRYYAAARALFIRANVQWEKENYPEAVSDYQRVADEHPDSHLAPVALYNAAAGLEESGDVAGAASSLETLLERYRSQDAPEIPRALFSLGRIQEQQSNFEAAAQRYRELIDSYGNSSWTSLARDRIIWLTTQGRIESRDGQG